VTDPRALRGAAVARLAEAGVASPEHDARALLAHAIGIPLGQVTLVRDVTEEQVVRFEELLDKRAAREPLQHLTGLAGFRYVTLHVGPGVFTPRPETEEVAGWAVDRALELDAPVVVDLCTGSGAIAASIAYEVPHARVHAVELDPAAHAWAERNLADTTVDLRLGDMADAFPELDGAVDVIACNPPYIPLEAFESVAPEARDHDPSLALWSGEDGLDAMRVLERSAARLLRPGGEVAAEHADVQGESAVAVFTGSGRWSEVRDHRDLAGRSRFVTARLAR
jgi:release factor glutamine methyltransferase